MQNSKKYIEYFSMWFTGSAKSLVPKLFAVWKHASVQRKMATMQTQLRADAETLAALQRQIDDLVIQRDVAQVESLAIRNDRKQADDQIERLNRKIASAGAYLEGSYQREGLVCVEGQLRVEAVSFLPPLVLESLLRGYHSVGFLQQVHSEFVPKTTPVNVASSLQTASNAASSSLRDERAGARKHSPVSGAPSGRGGVGSEQAGTAASMPFSAFGLPEKPIVFQDCLADIIKFCGTPVPAATPPPLERSEESAHTSAPLQATAVTTMLATVDAVDPSLAALPALSTSTSTEASLRTFAQQFQAVQQRMDAKNLFVHFTGSMPAVPIPVGGEGETDEDKQADERTTSVSMDATAEAIARVYEHTIRVIRAQDEHYARNTKLFSARMLESHEVSVAPTHFIARAASVFAAAPAVADATTGVTGAVDSETQGLGVRVSVDPTMAPLQSGDLGLINGARRYSVANLCLVKRTPLQPGQSVCRREASLASWSAPSNAALDRIAMIHGSDFAMSTRHSRAFVMVFLTHLVSEFGSLLFSPADMTPFLHSADFRESPAASEELVDPATSERRTIVATTQNAEHGYPDLVLAYDVWNRLAGQMIEADIVQNRGGSLVVPETASAANVVETTAVRPSSTPSSAGQSITRPNLQFHVEPVPQGILMTSSKEKDTVVGSGRPSLLVGETFHSARIRRLASHDVATLTQCVESLHGVVKTTSSRLHDFNAVRRQLSEFRQLQWELASELACQFASPPSVASSVATALDPNVPTATLSSLFASSSHVVDERKHAFECVSFDNPVIERIFSVEERPHDELARVRDVLERKKHLVRHLYTKYRPQLHHAVSLDDLWHFVKVLRLPKAIHMLPAMRDDDTTAASGGGFEQLFSPDDLTELLLHLCNEQFLPQVVPISARVEYLVTHHLPFAAQNQSLIRDVMHQTDVKRALTDHALTIRVIFRRYCAKERDSAAAGAGGATTGKPTNQQHPPGLRTGRHVGHGIARYMRLIDWLAFIQDYNLPRPRFPLDYAVTVFRNVQEVASSSSRGADDDDDNDSEQQLEMIYSEFCEALVSVAACYFPDPFVKSATKVSQFVRRFLPVSPDEGNARAPA